MSGEVLGASTTVSGVAGVAILPNTGSTRPLFLIAAVLLVGGLVTLAVSGIIAVKNRG